MAHHDPFECFTFVANCRSRSKGCRIVIDYLISRQTYSWCFRCRHKECENDSGSADCARKETQRKRPIRTVLYVLIGSDDGPLCDGLSEVREPLRPALLGSNQCLMSRFFGVILIVIGDLICKLIKRVVLESVPTS